jgi:hypothetical protein
MGRKRSPCAPFAIDQEEQNPKQVITHMEALVASMFSPRRQLPATTSQRFSARLLVPLPLKVTLERRQA